MYIVIVVHYRDHLKIYETPNRTHTKLVQSTAYENPFRSFSDVYRYLPTQLQSESNNSHWLVSTTKLLCVAIGAYLFS